MDRLHWKQMVQALAFVVPLLVLSWMLSRLHQDLRRPSPITLPDDCRVLILGDSHAVRGIDPDIVHPDAVNLSSPGENYMHNYYKLSYVLERTSATPIVIIPIDLHSFSDFRNDRVFFNLQWRPYLKYLEIGLQMGGLVRVIIKSFNLHFFEFRGDYGLLRDLIAGREPPPGPHRIDGGFKPRPGTYLQEREEKAARRADRQLKGFEWFAPEMQTYFRMILRKCRERRCPVVLLRLPITREYLQRARRYMPISRYYRKIFDLLPGDRNHITILDYHRQFSENQAWMFRDPQHLNETGARIISRILHRDLQNRGLLSR